MASRSRAFPALVLGPVDIPPWFLHRPFFTALAMQGRPWRVFAPHLRPRRQRFAINFQPSPASIHDACKRTGAKNGGANGANGGLVGYITDAACPLFNAKIALAGVALGARSWKRRSCWTRRLSHPTSSYC